MNFVYGGMDMESMEEIYKRRWLIFAAITMCTFIGCVDASSVNVALPGMADELGVTMAGIEWVVTAYTLVIICLILMLPILGLFYQGVYFSLGLKGTFNVFIA